MPDPLATLRKAHKTRRRGEEQYRAALLAAVAAGHTYVEIAQTLGVARQVIRTSVMRAQAHSQPQRED